ncbi:hypothetical protein XENTR_v10014319 [Xenopus tropicalis]|nr:hypothetical protein XENTR_v10014319 [Xenopus tropicalis]
MAIILSGGHYFVARGYYFVAQLFFFCPRLLFRRTAILLTLATIFGHAANFFICFVKQSANGETQKFTANPCLGKHFAHHCSALLKTFLLLL